MRAAVFATVAAAVAAAWMGAGVLLLRSITNGLGADPTE